MITMKNCAARSVISAPEIATAMAMTSSWAPRSRQMSLSRIPRPRRSDVPRRRARAGRPGRRRRAVGGRFEKPVADTAHRLDVPRARRIIAQFLAQFADVHVNGAIDHHGLVERIHVGQQLLSGEYA